MMEWEKVEAMNQIVNDRLNQLNEIIGVVLRHAKREMSAELAMHEIELLVTKENR